MKTLADLQREQESVLRKHVGQILEAIDQLQAVISRSREIREQTPQLLKDYPDFEGLLNAIVMFSGLNDQLQPAFEEGIEALFKGEITVAQFRDRLGLE